MINNVPYFIQSLGNHEFDDGISGLQPFINNVSYPIVCANCDFGKYSNLTNEIKPYLIHKLEGTEEKIGIVGYLTTDTPVRNINKTEIVCFIEDHNNELLSAF